MVLCVASKSFSVVSRLKERIMGEVVRQFHSANCMKFLFLFSH